MPSIILKREYIDFFHVCLTFKVCSWSSVPQELTGLFVEKPESVTTMAGITTHVHTPTHKCAHSHVRTHTHIGWM